MKPPFSLNSIGGYDASCVSPFSVKLPSERTSNFQQPIDVLTSSELVPGGFRWLLALHLYFSVSHDATNALRILLNTEVVTKE